MTGTGEGGTWARLRWQPVVAALVSLTLLGFAAKSGMDFWQLWPDSSPPGTRHVVTHIAPARVPSALPLVDRPGLDADGYPQSYVDRAALRSLLFARRFDDLSRYFDQFQTAFEQDPKKEYLPSSAGDAFESAEPELAPLLDAWVAATPQAFGPYLARATHWVGAAFSRRGAAYVSKTSSAQWSGMHDAVHRALPDLARALELRPQLVAALRQRILAAYVASQREAAREAIDRAVGVCPSCFQVRTTYMAALEPRWGGSYEAMDAFAASVDASKNPRLRLLSAFADIDRADVLRTKKQFDAALELVNRALALGQSAYFLSTRAYVYWSQEEYAKALADFNQAVELHADEPSLILDRALIEDHLRLYELAGQDLLNGLRVDPTYQRGVNAIAHVVQGLVYDGWNLHEHKDDSGALRLLDLAAELDPLNADVQSRRVNIMGGGVAAAKASIGELQAKADAAPDDFRAHQALDYALSERNEFPKIIEMWNEFLQRNPNDGHAYVERGGAYHRIGQNDAAYRDVARACELGVSEGCAFAKQVAPH